MIAETAGLTEYEQRIAQAWAERTKPPGDPAQIVDAVLRIFDITSEELCSESRRGRIVDARSIIAHILNRRGWTYVQIGTLMNRSDSAVTSLIKRVSRDHELGALARELAA